MKKIIAILTSALFLTAQIVFLTSFTVTAQDNPTPPPIELPILGTAVPTATPNPVQLFNALPAMGLQASDVPQFGNVTTTESPLSLEEMLAVLEERYPEQVSLVPLLGSFYSSVGVLGSHETLLLAEDCAGLSLFGVGSWLRLLPGVTSANALVDNPLAAELYGSIFQWHREEDSRGLQGILYTASVPSDLCSIASTVYILDYQFGPVTVAVSAYAPSTTSPDVVLGAFPPLIERINQRISGATGFGGPAANAIPPSTSQSSPTVVPTVTPTSAIEVDAVNDYDVLPEGYRVTITRYEIDPSRDTVRVHFEANYVRPPSGTYLQIATASGQILPVDESWESSGNRDVGWFEFDSFPFETEATLALVYGGTGHFTVPISDIRPYFVNQQPEPVVTMSASGFDTYPGGYRVSVQRIDIIPDRDVVRLYFDATAERNDLRSPEGSYLQTRSDRLTPTDANWASPARTYYSGWFEFDARPFRNEAGLRLMYCGCGLYDIQLPDLRNNF